MSTSHAQRNLLAAVWVGLLVALALLIAHLLAPGPLTDQDQHGGATVYFSADRSMVFAPGNCVTVTWRVDGVSDVSLDGSAVVPSASTPICVQPGNMPLLHVDFPDRTAKDYRLDVAFFLQQPGNWALIFAMGVLFFASLAFLGAPRTIGVMSLARAVIRVVLLMAFCVGFTALLMEIGLRVYFDKFGTPDEKIAYLYTRDQINNLNPYAMPLPEIDYGLSPDHPEHNRLGYRGADIQIPKPPGVFRIVAMGGSTTYGTSVKADETYPHDLQQILRDGYGDKTVEVVNAGVYGYTTYQDLANLVFRIPELDPDLVIVYDNANDVLTREVNPGCYRGVNPLLGLDPRGRVATSEYTEPLPPSTLYRFVAITFGLAPNPANLDFFFTTANVTCGDGKSYTPEQEVAANPPTFFERNLVSMIGIARIDSFQIAFASWPYEQQSTEPPPYWRQAIADQNVLIERVTQQYGVPFIDYAPAAPQDPADWADYIHMSALGSHDQAAFFARFLSQSGLLNASG